MSHIKPRDLTRLENYRGTRTVDSFHKELGQIMWEDCGMARSKESLERALGKIPANFVGAALPKILESTGRPSNLTLEQLKVRAEAWRDELGQGEVIQSESTVGGGSLPDECVSTYVLALDVKSPDRFLKKLREANPPIIARTENDKVLLDPRTVLNEDLLVKGLRKVLHDYH